MSPPRSKLRMMKVRFTLFICRIKIEQQSVVMRHVRVAQSWNVTTGWRTVCRCVHRAGGWSGGAPLQKAGCCPKSAAQYVSPQDRHWGTAKDNKGRGFLFIQLLFIFLCNTGKIKNANLWSPRPELWSKTQSAKFYVILKKWMADL